MHASGVYLYNTIGLFTAHYGLWRSTTRSIDFPEHSIRSPSLAKCKTIMVNVHAHPYQENTVPRAMK